VRMLVGVEPPAGTPAPTRCERLDQFADRAEAIRVRGKIQRSRRAPGLKCLGRKLIEEGRLLYRGRVGISVGRPCNSAPACSRLA
jgi:hypothetical protein